MMFCQRKVDRVVAETSGYGFVWLLVAGQFLAYFDRLSLAALAPLVAADLALDDAALGFLLGPAFAVPYALCAIVLGSFSDGRLTRRVLLFGLAVWTLATVAFACAPGVASASTARIAMGIGQAAFVPFAVAMVVANVSPEARPRYLSFMTASSSLGRSTSVFVSGLLLAALAAATWDGLLPEWRVAMLFTALPNIVVFAMLRWMLPAQPGAAPSYRVRVPPWLRANTRLAVLFGSLALMPILVIQSAAGWLTTYLTRAYALPVAEVATWFGLVTLATAPAGQLAGGLMFQKWPAARRRLPLTVAGMLATGAACFAAMTIVPGYGAALAAIAGGNLCLGVASFGGLFGLQELLPSDQRGAITALYFGLITVCGAGFGPLLVGLLSSRIGDLGMALVWIVGASALAGGALAAMLSRAYGRAVAQRQDPERTSP